MKKRSRTRSKTRNAFCFQSNNVWQFSTCLGDSLSPLHIGPGRIPSAPPVPAARRWKRSRAPDRYNRKNRGYYRCVYFYNLNNVLEHCDFSINHMALPCPSATPIPATRQSKRSRAPDRCIRRRPRRRRVAADRRKCRREEWRARPVEEIRGEKAGCGLNGWQEHMSDREGAQ
jgi:hypothetical protein